MKKKKSKLTNSMVIDSSGIATQRGVLDIQEIDNIKINVNYPKKFDRPPRGF